LGEGSCGWAKLRLGEKLRVEGTLERQKVPGNGSEALISRSGPPRPTPRPRERHGWWGRQFPR
jgi:hypothetical protein